MPADQNALATDLDEPSPVEPSVDPPGFFCEGVGRLPWRDGCRMAVTRFSSASFICRKRIWMPRRRLILGLRMWRPLSD